MCQAWKGTGIKLNNVAAKKKKNGYTKKQCEKEAKTKASVNKNGIEQKANKIETKTRPFCRSLFKFDFFFFCV